MAENETGDTVLTRCGILIYPWWGGQVSDGSDCRCCVCAAVYTRLKVIWNEAARS